MRTHIQICSIALLWALPAGAQIPKGSYLATTGGTAANRSIQVVDRFTGTATRLAISGFPFASTLINDTHIESPTSFLVAVQDVTRNIGDVYRVSYARAAWSAKRLTTTSTTRRLTAITCIGQTIYASGGSPGPGTANDNLIWRVPFKGGQPSIYVRHGRAHGGPAKGIGGPLVAVGTTLHTFMWEARGSGGEHWAIDTAKTPPTVRRVGGLMPFSKRYTCSKIPLLPVGASYDANSFVKSGGVFVIGGRIGDVLWRTPSGQNVRHIFVPAKACSTTRTDLLNSLGVNTDTGAILAGDSNRELEELVCDGGPWRLNAQTLPVAANSSINSLEYCPRGASYRKVGNGCKLATGQIPCNYVASLPYAGNGSFAVTLTPSNNPGIVILGGRLLNINLGSFGAPGCWIGPQADILVPARATTIGLTAAIPIPKALSKLTLWMQWIQVDLKANSLGLVVSDTRILKN